MPIVSSFLSTGTVPESILPDGRQLPIPVPWEIGSEPDELYGFPLSNPDWKKALAKAVDRSWKPEAWNLNGHISSTYRVEGWATSLGGSLAAGGGVPIEVVFSLQAEEEVIEGLPKPMPNFSVEPRTMINWLGAYGDGPYPNKFEIDLSQFSGLYPLMKAPNGTDLGGGLIVGSVSISASIGTYYARHNNTFYIGSPTISIQANIAAVFPGVPGAMLNTGTNLAIIELVGADSGPPAFDETAKGVCTIIDATRANEVWGQVSLYARSGLHGSCNLNLYVRRRFTESVG